ncbi:hypothetical protein J5754_00565 [bacterium]|nr:hypothetical protein [bacterium]
MAVFTNYVADTEKVVNGEFSKELKEKFYNAAFEIAKRKMEEGQNALKNNPPKREILPRLATGGGFSGLFVWDTCFCVMWAKYDMSLPVTTSLDNFYNLQGEDGSICREFSYDGKPAWNGCHPISWNPPLLSWAEWELYINGKTDKERLKKVWPNLKKFYLFCEKTYRQPDGLYFGDALGCGMDNLPRMPENWKDDIENGIQFKPEYWLLDDHFGKAVAGNPLYSWNKQMDWIDMSSQMALNAICMSRIASAIDLTEDAKEFKERHAKLKELINKLCYDEERGFYFDCYKGKVIPRYHVGCLWVLIAEVVPPERLEKVIRVLKDEKIFNRPVPFPSLPPCEKPYEPETGYWLGSNWPCTTYMALRGLKAMGAMEEAKYFAKRYYNANLNLFLKTGTVWENISPEQCLEPKRAGAGSDFAGWGNLPPIAVYKEFIEE